MGYRRTGAKKQGVDRRYGQTHSVSVRVDPFDAAVVNFQPSSFQIDKRVLVRYAGKRFPCDRDEQAAESFGLFRCGGLLFFRHLYPPCRKCRPGVVPSGHFFPLFQNCHLPVLISLAPGRRPMGMSFSVSTSPPSTRPWATRKRSARLLACAISPAAANASSCESKRPR